MQGIPERFLLRFDSLSRYLKNDTFNETRKKMFDLYFDDVIREFWNCSITNDFSNFDFEEFFQNFEGLVIEKLDSHGYGTLEAYRVHMEKGESLDESLPAWVKIQHDWGVWICETEIVDLILEHQMKIQRRDLPSAFDDLEELKERLENRDFDSSKPEDLKQLILLFDSCIHAEHASGMILENDIDDLRAEAEQNWLNERKEENKKLAKFGKIAKLRKDSMYI